MKLQDYNERTALAFWQSLGYDTLPEPKTEPELQTLDGTEIVQDAYLLHDDGTLRIYYLNLHESTRKKLRRLAEALYRRYPEHEHLITARSKDTPNLLFVHPLVLAKTETVLVLAIRTLEVQPDTPARSDIETLESLRITPDADTQTRIAQIRNAFDEKRYSEQFFQEFRRIFESIEPLITGIEDAEAKRTFAVQLSYRLLFLRFLEIKGWLKVDGQPTTLQKLWASHLSTQSEHKTFYDYLKRILFGKENGFFEPSEHDLNAHVPDAALKPFVEDLLYRYNYTTTESTRLENEVAADPEILGKVLEEQIIGRHKSGTYYTPRSVVAFMCREGIKGYLQTRTSEDPNAIACFVDRRDASTLRSPETVLDALRHVRVCDPACGSGAYLIGMLQELQDLCETVSQQRLDKIAIIQNNLYGVDINPLAIEITRLRLWLSLIADAEPEDGNLTLPNLEFKIAVGDSLLAPDPQGTEQPDMFRQQQIEEYEHLKTAYMHARSEEQKRLLREQIQQLRKDIRQWAHPNGDVEGFDWRVEFAEVFKDGGFDIIVANPPYVRHELIDASVKRKLLSLYSDAAVGRSDLYVYFYARALQLLKPGGMHVFICSNSWLDVDFGGKLQEYLLKNTHIQAIYESALERQFSSADVNTIISVIQKDG